MAETAIPVLPQSTLVQLYTRFLLNLPSEVKQESSKNFVRMFFELERAHWFYLDHYIEDPSVGGVDLFGFAKQSDDNIQLPDDFSEQCLLIFLKLSQEASTGRRSIWSGENIVERRKLEAPLSLTNILKWYCAHILLVQGFYGNRWSFPGGKVNENECLTECAAREVSFSAFPTCRFILFWLIVSKCAQYKHIF
ncbi:DCP2 decapping enzyme [Fasciola hepatica]|uniref:DCP2 decapping enzyme n=1 Tax=Fasciola hepatica TaxID=6192 RepID=A0A4E0QXR5_FASHE|nr:DCP2 decapping enzyme [Fasciola hepatica]